MGTNAPLLDIAEDSLVEFETEVLPIPQFDPENPKMISQGPSVCVFNKENSQEVLASWLFAQYLLSNDVQIAYSETEGYLPVTTKAQETPAYQEYLSRMGEDNDEHYEVKINASKILMANTENTFVTPVFNGSASLRDAAGALIEDVTKSVRRKKTVDDAYIENLYSEVTSLYHLDQIVKSDENGTPVRKPLGRLPKTAITLLAILGAAWVLIGGYYLIQFLRGKYKK